MIRTPKLDKSFLPMYRAFKIYTDGAQKSGNAEVVLCVERTGGYNFVFRYTAYADNTGFDNENIKMAERLAKTILWVAGGYKIYVAGSKVVYNYLLKAFSAQGKRAFDGAFMSQVFEREFQVVYCEYDEIPSPKKQSLSAGGNFEGRRIGFDAGGSDMKVSAVADGKTVFSEEIVWHPKLNSQPEYHYNAILKAWEGAAAKMSGVDAIGVSSAGIYIDNKVRAASLFIKVGKEDFEKKVTNIYIDLAKKFGVPLTVANDGDVTALAGSMSIGQGKVLGIAMGTSEAAGYADGEKRLNGHLNELAFVPVDYSEKAEIDEWSGDYGCGVKYFSQDGVIKLAKAANFEFEEGLTPAEKLKVMQKELEKGNSIAYDVFSDIGIYLGHTVPYYAMFYDIEHMLILGRVVSGKGGDIILNTAKEIIEKEYPFLNRISMVIPSEKERRVGQSVAAASLPVIGERK